MILVLMVPSARLELAQLSPLPPQDSVSTNFTTTAGLDPPWHVLSSHPREPLILTLNHAHPALKNRFSRGEINSQGFDWQGLQVPRELARQEGLHCWQARELLGLLERC